MQRNRKVIILWSAVIWAWRASTVASGMADGQRIYKCLKKEKTGKRNRRSKN
jgi:hypothetical protein